MGLAQRFSAAWLLAALLAVVAGTVRWVLPAGGLLGAVQRPRAGAADLRSGERTDRLVESLQRHLHARPDDREAYVQLGSAYLQKARETGDPEYYTRADAVLQRALELWADDSEAMTAKGALALARHHFQEALEWGRKAMVRNPNRAAVYGVIGDALVELGRYDEAVEAVQRMADLRPDLASYSRVAYLRELHGDVDGAIEAMSMAVQASAPVSEARAWTQVQLGHLYFGQGRLAEAEASYVAALSGYAEYIPAVAAMGRLRAAQGRYTEAASLLGKAADAMPLPEYVILLGDVHAVSGRADEAARQYALLQVIDMLQRANGVDTDLEMALFRADHDVDLAEALARASEQYGRRPSIHAADVLAWTLYHTGACEEGLAYARQALRLGTRDALMHYHAGMLALCTGDRPAARVYLGQALAINPSFSVRYAPQAQRALASITDGGQ